MAALDLKLEEKKWYFALGIGLVLAVVLAGVVQYLWFSGINDDIKRKRVELDGLNQEIQKGRAAERKLSQFREEVKRLELELGKLLLILPSQRNTEELIKRVEALTTTTAASTSRVNRRAVSRSRVMIASVCPLP